MTSLRISRTHYPVRALGPGTRLGVWVQGCELACKGCMSLDTWPVDGGVEVPVADLVGLWGQAVDRGATGLTVSGGEPLRQTPALAEFLVRVDEVRKGVPQEPDVLVYTGFEEDELDQDQLRALDHADVVVFGRFDVSMPTRLVWRGSANQRMVTRTELGARRYADWVDHEPDLAPLQVEPRPDGRTWIIGTPRRGDLSAAEREIRDLGLRVEDVTWRP